MKSFKRLIAITAIALISVSSVVPVSAVCSHPSSYAAIYTGGNQTMNTTHTYLVYDSHGNPHEETCNVVVYKELWAYKCNSCGATTGTSWRVMSEKHSRKH